MPKQRGNVKVSTRRSGEQGTRVASEAEVLNLAERLRAFKGDRLQGEALQQGLRQLGQVRMGSRDPAVLAIRKAVTLERAKRIDQDFGIDRKDRHGAPDQAEADAARLAALAPFLGIEPDGAATYHDPLTIDDEQAVAWAGYMAAHPVIPDKRMRAFLDVLLDVRPRHLWRAAAEALAAFAARGDAPTRDRLVELGERFEMLQDRPRDGGAEGAPPIRANVMTAPQRHLRRHVRYALACWRALGEPPFAPPSFRAPIPGSDLPKDSTEASIDVLCLAARLRAERDRAELLPRVGGLLAGLDADPVMEEALRFLYPVLVECAATHARHGGEALAALEEILQEPSWLAERERATVDRLWSWLSAIGLLSDRHPELDAVLSDRYPDLADLLHFRFAADRLGDPIAPLLARLSDLLDPARFAVKTPFHQALCVCEIVVLLNHPRVSPVDWRALVAAALGASAPADGPAGPAGQVGLAAILEWIARLHDANPVPGLTAALQPAWFPRSRLACYLPLGVIRDRAVDAETIIALAAVHHGWVVNQVAVQAERHLRRLHAEPAEQIRFLWRLLEVDPLTEVFVELLNDLRGEHTTLRSLVEQIRAMDMMRAELASTLNAEHAGAASPDDRIRKLVVVYEDLVKAALAHLGEARAQDDPVAKLLSEGLQCFKALDVLLAGVVQPALGELCKGLESCLRGERGLPSWFDWVDGEPAGSVRDDVAASAGGPQSDRTSMSAAGVDGLAGMRSPRIREGSASWCDLTELARELRQHVIGLEETAAGWVPGLLQPARETCGRLRVRLEGAPWPERIALAEVLERIDGQLLGYGERAVLQQTLADQVTAGVDARDAARLVGLVRDHSVRDRESPPLAGLRPSLLEAMHEVLREADDDAQACADKLRQLCLADGSHARLPPIVEYDIRERRVDKVLEITRRLDTQTDLGAETLSRINDFLLERLYLGQAARVRRIAARRVRDAQENGSAAAATTATRRRPRSWLIHLSPLLVGVPAGTLLVLDVGTAWSEVLLPGHEWAFRGTLLVSLALAFLTLVGGLARHTADDARKPGLGGAMTWIGGLARRGLPVFLGAWSLAFVCSFLVLISLTGTSETLVAVGDADVALPLLRQTLLWSSLSLFLGIFLGLIAQGRGLYGRKDPTED